MYSATTDVIDANEETNIFFGSRLYKACMYGFAIRGPWLVILHGHCCHSEAEMPRSASC